MGGAFQTSREIFENPIWNDVPKFRIFFYIYGKAVFSEEGIKVGGVKVNRGQFLRSYRNLREDLQYIENRSVKKYSLSLIKRKIEQLVKEERLKIEDTELGTLFTVVNYALYQGFDNYKNVSENAERTQRERSENGNGTERERSENNNKNGNKVKKDKKDNKTPSHKFQTCDMEMAQQLFNRILENNENAKEPNFEKWANEFRLMRESDHRTEEQLRYLIDWTQQDSFWKSNILSPSKLRKHFDRLAIKVKEDIKKQNQAHDRKPKAYQSLEDWADEA